MPEHEVYYVPRGVELAHPEVREALAAIGIEQRSYVANGALNHTFTDLVRGKAPRRLFVVEGLMSKRLSEVVGDTTLWLLVAYTARRACAAPALSGTGETVEQASHQLDEVEPFAA